MGTLRRECVDHIFLACSSKNSHHAAASLAFSNETVLRAWTEVMLTVSMRWKISASDGISERSFATQLAKAGVPASSSLRTRISTSERQSLKKSCAFSEN